MIATLRAIVVMSALCLLAIAAQDPQQAIFEAAAKSLVAGDYPAAERGFQAVLKVQPNHVGALGNLGIIYSRTGRTDQAITVYRKALALSPNDKAILLNLGLVYLKQEAHRKALPLFERVVAVDAAHQQARQLVAICRLYLGELEPAIRDLEALQRENSNDQQTLFLLGFAYLKNNDAETAKRIFDRMFAVAGPAQAEFLLGKACYEAALFDRAEESYLKVAQIAPDFPGIRLELGKLYISQRRTEDAIKELESVLKDQPANEDANYYLGGLLVQEARYEEGIPYLERARKLKPDSWSILFYLGKAKLRLGQPAEAVTLLQKAVALNPDETSAYYQLGRALQACGRQQEALRAFSRVQNLKAGAPKDAAIVGIR
jgi:tetratricopeptide (TPR) repeat protein